MNKSPEQYFQDQNFSADAIAAAKPGEFTDAERAFMEKYLGVDGDETLRKLGIEPPSTAVVTGASGSAASPVRVNAPDAPPADAVPEATAPAPPAEESLDDIIKRSEDLLLVAFHLGSQEFVVPTLAVQEVIRYVSPTKLPASQGFVAGVINLRGKITPLIRLRDLLDIPAQGGEVDAFTIICRRQGLQLGLMIEKVHTMYRVHQRDIDWAVEAHLGSGTEYIAGLLKMRESLIGIVSVDKIVETTIKR